MMDWISFALGAGLGAISVVIALILLLAMGARQHDWLQ